MKFKMKYFLLMILFINIFTINAYSVNIETKDKIKVGVYRCEPYYYMDSDGNISGYYHDFLKLLQRKYDFEYEYVLYNFEDEIRDLQEGKIDIMLGISILPERIDKLAFNKNFIAREDFALLTNKDIKLDDLKNIDGLKIGLVKNSASVDRILSFLSASGIDAEPVYGKDWMDIRELLDEGKVDIILHNNYEKLGYKVLYEIQGDQVYIAANKNRADILEKMDIAIEELREEKTDKINELYNKYFNENYYKLVLKEKILLMILIVLSILIITIFIIPKVNKRRVKSKIRYRIRDNKYLLQYQPIYNPRDNSVVGFEGLLRLLDENKSLIPPYKFIHEIEKNDMLFEVSLWILEKVINDYKDIENYNCVRDKEFYISLNLSLEEIENDDFVKKAIEILSDSNLGSNKICLEIIERVKMKNLDKISKNINTLKMAGFKIAIDDFGVEYSNLDILHSLDTDVIKVDKRFVDGIHKDTIRNEIILFISRIAKSKDKAVVLEGVEEEVQDAKIKEIENDKMYVQGYYYSKPLYKEDLKKL